MSSIIVKNLLSIFFSLVILFLLFWFGGKQVAQSNVKDKVMVTALVSAGIVLGLGLLGVMLGSKDEKYTYTQACDELPYRADCEDCCVNLSGNMMTGIPTPQGTACLKKCYSKPINKEPPKPCNKGELGGCDQCCKTKNPLSPLYYNMCKDDCQ